MQQTTVKPKTPGFIPWLSQIFDRNRRLSHYKELMSRMEVYTLVIYLWSKIDPANGDDGFQGSEAGVSSSNILSYQNLAPILVNAQTKWYKSKFHGKTLLRWCKYVSILGI